MEFGGANSEKHVFIFYIVYIITGKNFFQNNPTDFAQITQT